MNQTLRKKEHIKAPEKVNEVLNDYFKEVDERLPKCMLQERISMDETKVFSRVRILMRGSCRCFVLFTATGSMRTSLKRTVL